MVLTACAPQLGKQVLFMNTYFCVALLDTYGPNPTSPRPLSRWYRNIKLRETDSASLGCGNPPSCCVLAQPDESSGSDRCRCGVAGRGGRRQHVRGPKPQQHASLPKIHGQPSSIRYQHVRDEAEREHTALLAKQGVCSGLRVEGVYVRAQ